MNSINLKKKVTVRFIIIVEHAHSVQTGRGNWTESKHIAPLISPVPFFLFLTQNNEVFHWKLYRLCNF